MRINGIHFDEIPLDKIRPIYIEDVSKSRQGKMMRIIKRGKMLSNHMIVERKDDLFYLVAGFPEYEAYRIVNSEAKICHHVPCFIQPYTDGTEQRITLLKRMFLNQTTKWRDKHNQIRDLIENEKGIKQITKELGTTESDIRAYLIHPDIPKHIIRLAEENRESFPNLERIRKLGLSVRITERVYERAVLRLKDPNRLTTEKIKMIKWLLDREGFWEMKPRDKRDLLLLAMEFNQL